MIEGFSPCTRFAAAKAVDTCGVVFGTTEVMP